MTIIILRTIIIFLGILTSMRIMGKRQLGELEINELVVAVLVADLASHPLQDVGMPLMNGLVPLATLLCCELIFSGIMMHSPTAKKLLTGKPSILISNGAINQLEMRKNRFTLDELAEELRTQGITDISKVKYAILETDGRVNTLLYPSEQPVTAGQLNIQVPDPGYTAILISDGKISHENLRVMDKSEAWLMKELKKRNAKSPKEVYLLSLNHRGEIYYAAKEN